MDEDRIADRWVGVATSALVSVLVPVVVSVLVVAAAFALTWQATRASGAFATTDSWTYLGVANNLSSGQGITSPFSNEWDGLPIDEAVRRDGQQPLLLWPPLYPIVLAGPSTVSDISPAVFARVLGALAAALSAGLAFVLGRALARSWLAGLVVAALFIVNTTTQLLFATISSEALFAPLLLAAVLVMWWYLSAPSWPRLGVVAVAVGALALTRYAGVAAVPAGIIAVVWPPASWRLRLARAGVFSLVAVGPLLVWTVVSRAGITARNRGIGSHGRWQEIGEWLRLPSFWLAPPRPGQLLPPVGLGLAAAVVAVIAVLGWVVALRMPERDRPVDPPRLLALVCLVTVVAYILLFVVSANFLDRRLTLDQRQLMPIAPVALALVVSGWVWLLRLVPRPARYLGASVAAVAAALVIVNLAEPAFDLFLTNALPGVLAAPEPGEDIAYLHGLGDETLVFSNSPTALYARARLGAVTLPALQFPSTGKANPQLDDELELLGQLLRTRDSAVVFYVPTLALSDHVPTEPEIVERLGLRLEYGDAYIRAYRSDVSAEAGTG